MKLFGTDLTRQVLYSAGLQLCQTCPRFDYPFRLSLPETLTIYLFKDVDPWYEEEDGPILPCSTILQILKDPERARRIGVLQIRLYGCLIRNEPAIKMDRLLELVALAKNVHTVRYLVQKNPTQRNTALTLQRPYYQSGEFVWDSCHEDFSDDEFNEDNTELDTNETKRDRSATENDADMIKYSLYDIWPFDDHELYHHKKFLPAVKAVELWCPEDEADYDCEVEWEVCEVSPFLWNAGWNAVLLDEPINAADETHVTPFGPFILWNFDYSTWADQNPDRALEERQKCISSDPNRGLARWQELVFQNGE